MDNNLSRKNAIIILSSVLCFIFIGGYFLLKNDILNRQGNNNLAFNNNSAMEWLFYKNDEFNFSVQYPSDWSQDILPYFDQSGAKQYGGISLYKQNGVERYQLSIIIYNNSKGLSIKDWLEKNRGTCKMTDVTCSDNVRIGKYTGYKVSHVFNTEGFEDQLFIAKDQRIYSFVFPVAEENGNYYKPVENYQVAQKIISTFTFLD